MTRPLLIFNLWWQKNGKTQSGDAIKAICARVAMEEQLRKTCSVCELARALVNRGQSMKIATFSSWDLQEQCRKSYVASYWANEELIS